MTQEENRTAPPPLPCLGCGKCEKECFANVPIHLYFGLFNEALELGGATAELKERYREISMSGTNTPASECVGCRKCEAACPEHIQISEMNGIVALLFE